MFRATLPPIVITCHKMPRQPRNLHVVTTWRSPTAAPATQNDDGGLQSAAPGTQNANHLLKEMQEYAPATQNDFRHYMTLLECHNVPRLPRETKLRDI